MTNGQQTPAQVQAQTGNSMIPSNPNIPIQQVQGGAIQQTPHQAGAPAVVPAPQVDSSDFWGNIDKQTQPGLPPAQQEALQPLPEPVQQPTLPAAVPGEPAALPAPDALTPEQLAVITEAGAHEAGYVQPQPAQPLPQPVQDTRTFEEQTIQNLAQSEYALPEAEATKMMTNPEEVFPLYAARLHVRLASQLGQAVQQILPSLINTAVDSRMKAQALENDFFTTYPQLRDARFRPVVAQSLRMAKQASPQASREQIMQDGAALAVMKLRIAPQQMPVQQQVAPLAPIAQIPVQAQPLQPFAPAIGGGGLPIQPQVPLNEFEEMANDLNW